jgi:hypothetical protein
VPASRIPSLSKRDLSSSLLERAAQTDDPREASKLVKQAADILALVAEFERVSSPNGGVPLALDTQ